MAATEADRGTANRILLALPETTFLRLRPRLERIRLPRSRVLYQVDAPLTQVYFPDQGIVSLIKTMRDGRTVEIGAIGIEGMVCPSVVFGVDAAILEAVVQIPGTALCLERGALQDEIGANEEVRHLMQRYMRYTISELAQGAACNRLHSLEERCCRWLLIAQDSARSNTFPLTHEFLAMMLGVQRAGVSITANALQRAGLISYTRGRVTVTDRQRLLAAACECYGANRARLDQVFRRAPS